MCTHPQQSTPSSRLLAVEGRSLKETNRKLLYQALLDRWLVRHEKELKQIILSHFIPFPFAFGLLLLLLLLLFFIKKEDIKTGKSMQNLPSVKGIS